MPRRKAVEGLTLDLTEMPMGEFDVGAFLEAEMQRAAKEGHVKEKVKKEKKEKKVTQRIVRDTSVNLATLREILVANKKCLYCDNKVLINERCNECRESIRKKNMEEMREYLFRKGVYGCAFCKKPHTESMSGFHFDHLNIYDKTDNVGFMLSRYIDMTKVYEEIEKCQLLCTMCHAVVTKMEVMNGFIRDKIRMKRGLLKTPIEELAVEYDMIMKPIYDEMRRLLGGEK
jgi:hypothetical protein